MMREQEMNTQYTTQGLRLLPVLLKFCSRATLS
jgi:hypothetical protein